MFGPALHRIAISASPFLVNADLPDLPRKLRPVKLVFVAILVLRRHVGVQPGDPDLVLALSERPRPSAPATSAGCSC